MIETYTYKISDKNNENNMIKCKIEYDTNNNYNTNYYFCNGTEWMKDFIDLDKLSSNTDDPKTFDEFITKVHDFMVHGNLWEELKKVDDGQEINKESYELVIKARKQ